MAMLFDPPTTVDAAPSDTTWSHIRIVRVELARIDAKMRANPLWDIQRLARWAVLGTDQWGGVHVLATDADAGRPIVVTAVMAADVYGADFTEPPACTYCGAPIPDSARYCSPYETNCWLLDGRRESSWRTA